MIPALVDSSKKISFLLKKALQGYSLSLTTRKFKTFSPIFVLIPSGKDLISVSNQHLYIFFSTLIGDVIYFRTTQMFSIIDPSIKRSLEVNRQAVFSMIINHYG